MQQPDLTIVFGVSGAGKTTACAKLAQRHDQFRHVSASQLISQGVSFVNRSVTELHATQEEIVERVCQLRENELRRIVLDGHCVIRLATGLYQVPSDLIAALSPKTIVLIEARPETIQKRRNERDLRVEKVTLEEVDRELALTRETCAAYERNLSIPVKVLNGDESDVADQLFACLT